MFPNIAEWINGIISGMVYALGYIAACSRVLYSPVRAPLKLFFDLKSADTSSLAP